ncbi:AarF/ABC1/UbiB kinase family protein [Thalassotalea ponticola]|uniref:ABC1 kinase family protein n=1 Tax=Thalassotalea ponticola TaxID=1523392 RepID=UPI0025B5BF19|nr:AarF/ABC1/UbiB kinase family protein [Thalassotalea ponticola]MDN3651467.1 AarF/ABC1/UbiB kinase family protein [Thalassotalea ponticola]
MSGRSKVPTTRLSRLSSLGGLVAKVASNVVIDGVKTWRNGESSSLQTLLVKPHNIRELADKLAHLRGAAMKVGQLISMDSNDLLGPELSHLLERLRSNGDAMTAKQLSSVLVDSWGANWLDSFSHFDLKPFACASIGQVHQAYLENGQKLAVKVQFPGVRDSIDSDIDNVLMLLKMSGFLPKHLAVNALVDEAKQQLMMEADYLSEAAFIEQFYNRIDDRRFIVPTVHKTLTNKDILVMDYIEGQTIDSMINEPQQVRDALVESLIGLFFKELFELKLMQTDPNFANYLYQHTTDRIALLDFGATRTISANISAGYQRLISAGKVNHRNVMIEAARDIGFFQQHLSEPYLQDIVELFTLACEPLSCSATYDFGRCDLALRIKAHGQNIQRQKEQWHTPPVDSLFIHRKLIGLYLLATQLKARVNVRKLFAPYSLATMR